MRYALTVVLAVTLIAVPCLSAAVEEADFEVKTTRALLNLCEASSTDPLFGQAINFCHGYLIGAYHYYQAMAAGPDGPRLVCLPDPAPTRNEAIAMFIEWARNHPEYWDEPPVETEFRFLTEKWPCKP